MQNLNPGATEYHAEFSGTLSRQPLRRSLASMLVAIVATLPCTPLMAEESSEPDSQVAKANSLSIPDEEFAWMSGGIGDEALQEMRKAARAYNVHVLFTDRQGSYLANIPFTVLGQNNQTTYTGVSDGPLLYLRLPAGAYRVSAKIDNVWQTRPIRVATTGRPAKLSFVARGE